jgi:CrcB protein
MKELALVGFGGLIGSISRYGLSIWTVRYFQGYLQTGTLAVNLVGSLLIGLLAGCLLKNPSAQSFYLFAVTGFCGGFTTFSTFSLDNLRLLKEQLYLQLAVYGIVSIAGGLALCLLGFWFSSKYLT